MPAVNWDQPSGGSVSDPNPALTLKNDNDGALLATSEGVAVEAESKTKEAVVGRTEKTLAGRFTSDQSVGVLGVAPKSAAVLGVNQNGNLPATAGMSAVDPAVPNPQNNPGGIGVLGLTNRFRAIGAAGIALGNRSTGVHGEAVSGVGVHGRGSSGGVEGISSGSPGVAGFTQSDRSSGVFGFGPGQSAGVRGEAIAGPGVAAHASAGPGVQAHSDQAHGVMGEAKASNASGVLGRNDHTNGVGVDGYSNSGIAVRAISTKGTAVHADTWGGRALDASNFSNSEPAAYILAPASNAVEANTFGGSGVDALGKTGVWGSSLSNPDPTDPKIGSGLMGTAIAGSGVCGVTLTGSAVRGIGHPQFGAWAGNFEGNVIIQGLLFKYASLFSIDHPLDPRRKTLNHASVEAPEYKTLYDGVVTLNTRGRARVRLPRWFSALNGNPHYQLTPLGRPAPDLHVAQEMKNNAFVIAGGRPRQKVCWQVTGVRRDSWAKANPLKVEQPKRRSRPSEVPPSVADLRKMRDSLRRKHSALRRAGTARARSIRGFKPSKPVALPRAPKSPAVDDRARKIAERTLRVKP